MYERCAHCNKNITNELQVESQLYSPNQRFLLCESCGNHEEAEVERIGCNINPQLITQYCLPDD
jgi:hypothetical protein